MQNDSNGVKLNLKHSNILLYWGVTKEHFQEERGFRLRE